MEGKTIKELAVELTVEVVEICDTVKGRSVFINQLRGLVLPLVQMRMKRSIPK